MDETERQNAIRAFDREDELHSDLMRASLDSAREAIRAMLILNGGASIALLGFLATTFSEEVTAAHGELHRAIFRSLGYFACGALAAVLTSALAYIVNSLYAGASAHKERQWDWPYLQRTPSSKRCWIWAQILNWAAVLIGTLSLVAFAVGVVSMRKFIL